MFKRSSDAPAGDAADAVQQARTRARRRLIGAVILLGIGIIGFPLVFETRPRPIPIDIPIEIPRKDNAPPLAMPPARSRPITDPGAAAGPGSDVITESSADAGREVPPPESASRARPDTGAGNGSVPAPSPPAPATAHATVTASAPAVRGTPVASAPAAPAVAAAHPPAGGTAAASGAARAQALLEGKPASAAETARYVVQVGAFAEADSAREARLKVEKMGLKTYTQVAQTPSGNRIRVRVGPFASRAEADAALAKAKAGGFSAVVLTL